MLAFDTALPLALGLALASLVMACSWLWQRQTHNAGIVDVVWSGLVGLLAVFYALWPAGPWQARAIVGVMFALWSLRLTTYLARRVIGHPEDGRYRALRASWGANFQPRMFAFFQVQALAAWCFAGVALAVARSRQMPSTAVTTIAILLWIVGVAGVAAADRQLESFKRDESSRGKTCRSGLWHYSRHPNYFFEWLHWCSYIPLATESPGWWAPVGVAAALLYLLLFVTGIPPSERQAVASRGDEYRDYQRSTSAFVPWFPKASSKG